MNDYNDKKNDKNSQPQLKMTIAACKYFLSCSPLRIYAIDLKYVS